MNTSILKITALTVLTLLSVSSCSVDDDFSDLEKSQEKATQASIAEEKDEIVFRVKTKNDARSASSSEENSVRQFKITAYEEGKNYYEGATDVVTTFDNGVSWSSDHSRYWPGNRPSSWTGLTFYAYTEGNSKNRSVRDENGAGIFDLSSNIPMIKDFKVMSDVSEQRNLMYAVAKDVNKNGGDVTLDFKHALCKVNFSITNNDPCISSIKVMSIELGGVKGVGSFQFPDISSQKQSAFRIADDEPKGKWTFSPNTQDETYLLTDVNLNQSSTGQSNSSVISESLLLIPQTVEAKTDKSSQMGGYIKVTIQITPNGSTQPRSPETVFLPTDIDWKEGKNYCYDITWNRPFTIITLRESPI